MTTKPGQLLPTWLLALAGILPFLGFWAYGLTDLDEGFYAAVVNDMLRRGDWLTPTLNGTPWFEKPILAYWLAMPTVSLWHNEFGARLPSFVCTLATAWIVLRTVSARFGQLTGQLATLVFTGCILVAGVGRMMMTDAPFVLCLTGAFLTYYKSFVQDQRWRLATAALLGLAVLAKGPVALLLFAVVAGLSAWKYPARRREMTKYWLTGTVILAAVLATWYLPAWLVHRDLFVQKFLIEQNLQRFGGGDRAHATPAWMIPVFFPAVILVCYAWWLGPAFRSQWLKNRQTGDTEQGDFRRYLWIWAMVVLVFFSLSGSKLPHYIMPALVPFSILIADAVMDRHPCGHQPRFWLNYGVVWNVVLCVVLNMALTMYSRERFMDAQELARHAATIADSFVLFSKQPEAKSFGPTMTLADTSQPSVYFYYRRKALDWQKLDDFDNSKCPVLVLSRDNEFMTEATKRWGKGLNAGVLAYKDRWSLVRVISFGE